MTSERFPEDFMFRLTKEEFKNLIFHFGIANLKSQNVTSSWGGTRKSPRAFTEQGVAMLSSVLHSKRAILVNIAIMRTLVKLREIFSTHKELAHKLSQLKRKIENHDEEIKTIFDAIRQLTIPKYSIWNICPIYQQRQKVRFKKLKESVICANLPAPKGSLRVRDPGGIKNLLAP